MSDATTTRLRRSVLFMPGDGMRKIEKAAGLDVDTIVMDLEDGVALGHKAEARATTIEALRTVDFGGRERWVRINPADTDLFEGDLDCVAEGKPDGVLIPKVGSPEDVTRVVAGLEARARTGETWQPGIAAILESARGIVRAGDIAASSGRLVALMFGAEDLAGDVGLTRTREGLEILHARSAVSLAAAAYGLTAIDTLFTDLTDLEGLAQDTRVGIGLGFDGKIAIHPRQVEVIHRCFAPSAEEVDRARRLIAEHEAQQAAGAGAFEFEGKMVDMPMVRAAEKVLARAAASGA